MPSKPKVSIGVPCYGPQEAKWWGQFAQHMAHLALAVDLGGGGDLRLHPSIGRFGSTLDAGQHPADLRVGGDVGEVLR